MFTGTAKVGPKVSPSALGSGAMFDGIAKGYDRLNTILSLGLHKGWRKKAVRALALGPNARALDVATGTGDLAFEMLSVAPDIRVSGLDPSAEMLSIAEQKAAEGQLSDRVDFCLGDAGALPFPDEFFDGVGIAFGIRNVPDRLKALGEISRVLKPGARIAVLELSHPSGSFFARMGGVYIKAVVPTIGRLFSRAEEYRYLKDSIAEFPPADEFLQTMQSAGFKQAAAQPLAFGACVLYRGVKP